MKKGLYGKKKFKKNVTVLAGTRHWAFIVEYA